MTDPKTSRREARRAAAHRRTEPGATPAGETAERTKPVRITVDLTPEVYKRFTRWTNQAALDLDVSKLAQAQVVRAFIRLLEDPAIEERVHSTLRDMQ